MVCDEEMIFSEDSTLENQSVASSATSLSSAPIPPEKSTTSTAASPAHEIAGLYSENAAAKIWRVATAYLEQVPTLDTYPEYVPATGEGVGTYLSKPAAFWTCGFFPASLYCLLERSMKFPQCLPRPTSINAEAFHHQLLRLCHRWSAPLHANATRTNSHDLGFIMRSLRMDWELTGNLESLQSYLSAAESLATRYDERVGAIRSWDRALSHSYEIVDKENNFLIIIDSMCNMDLLYYAAHHTANTKLGSIATSHAHTVLRTIVRCDKSTYHVANLDPQNKGAIKLCMTHQGYSDTSTWSRGQAWGILGFIQAYGWTSEPAFLSAAQDLSDYFLARLASSPAPTHPYVPLWDFDAPLEDEDTEGQPLRDTSAGMIAANGMLLLHQVLQAQDPAKSSRYLEAALQIARDTVAYSLDKEDVASFSVGADGRVLVAPGTWDTILKHSTANNNKDALVRYRDHGLVYADYYFLEFGNKLLRMGLV